MLTPSLVLLSLVASVKGGETFVAEDPNATPVCPGQQNCPPGYTGHFCDIVLCDSKGVVTPPSSVTGYGIDIVPLATCKAVIPVPVDSHIQVLLLYLDGADYTANPSITLSDAAGNVIPPTETVTTTNKTLVVGWSAPARGRFYATVSAATTCLYQAQAQTNFTVSVGFTYGSRSIHADAPSSTLTEFNVATMIASLNNMPSPGHSRITEVYADNQLVTSYDNKVRYGCAYGYYATPVICNSAQNWYFKLHGRDENGFEFMRTDVFRCTASGPTTTTTTGPMTTTNAPACLHNGFLDPTTNKCICDFIWTGDKCQTPVCGNGGSPNADNSGCVCVTGYGGFNCFEPVCTSMNPMPPVNGQQKTIGLVIQATQSMATAVQGLKDYVPELIETLNQQEPTFVKNYMVVSYDDTGATLLTSGQDPLLIISHIQQLTLKQGTVKCQKQLNAALKLALANVPDFSSTFVWTDSPVDLTDHITSLDVIDMLEKTKNRLSIFYAPEPACQALNSSEVDRLYSLTEFTGGQMYYTKTQRASFWLSHVPATAYLTARAFDRADDRCDVRRTAYVPIDSRTAAFTFSVAGNSPSIVVKQPNGELWPMVPILNDELMHVQQAITPCGDGWEQRDNQCFYANSQGQTWSDAQLTCRLKGATLANIMNSERQRLLDRETARTDYWTGLHDLKYHGAYEWDSIAVPAIPLLAASYRNWAAGQPNDPSNQASCVGVKYNGTTSGKWYTLDCNTVLPYVCQKPALEFYNNQLPAGIWKVDYQTRNGTEWGTSCVAKVDVQTTLMANWGFTLDQAGQFNDMPVAEPKSSSTTNRVIMNVTNLMPDSRVAQVQFFDSGNRELILSSRLHRRVKCAYGYYSDQFVCPKNAFGIEFSGHDEMGYLWTRQGYGICLGGSTEEAINSISRKWV